jgi:hypothetical protein
VESKEPIEVVTLGTLADGAALELFQNALDQVLKNIDDPNTEAHARRAIRLEIGFVADEDRRVSNVEVKCTTKLAGVRGAKTLVYIGRHEGQLVAVEQPRQTDLFPKPGGKLVDFAGGKADA